MAKFTGQDDEQVAVGAIIGGTSQLIGPTAMTAAKWLAVKCGALSSVKAGIGLGLSFNPIFGGIAVIGGAGYLIYKACK